MTSNKWRFRLPWRSRSVIASEVDAELKFHLESRATELETGGLSPAAARAQAEREFGDIEFTRRYCRDADEGAERSMRLSDRLSALSQDVAYAWRTLRRSPGFTAVSLLTLALSIGANTAIFSVARAVLFRPLPYGSPAPLIALYENNTKNASPRNELSPADFADYRARQHTLSGLGAFGYGGATYRDANADPLVLSGLRVTANLFDVLQVGALRGRTFAADEDTPAKRFVVILSFSAWQKLFGGDTAVVGRDITLNERAFKVIGVMPQGFTLGRNEEMWTPLDYATLAADPVRGRKFHFMYGIGRVKPGVSIVDARADLLAISHQLESEHADVNIGHLTTMISLHDAMLGDARPALLMLCAAALLVLLIACANLANVTLSRTVGRRREMAVRAAIGAGRGRLVRQLLTETVLLAVVGGAIGVGLAMGAARLLLALNPNALPPVAQVSVDSRVLLFSLIVSVGTGILFGLFPSLDGSRFDLHTALKDSGRSSSGGAGGGRVRRMLVAAQVALAVVLLVGAGLLLRSFGELQRVRTGFNSANVLTAQVSAFGPRYQQRDATNLFFDGVLEKVRATPGVELVGGVSALPTDGNSTASLFIEGVPSDPNHPLEIAYMAVRGDYFRVMRVPLKRGRLFDATDLPAGTRTVVVNEAMAKRFFPSGDALGHRVRLGPNPADPYEEIVGVVGDIRQTGIDADPKPTAYANDRQEVWGGLFLTVRTTGDPLAAASAIKHAVREMDPTLAVRLVRTMDDIVGASLASRRFALVLVASFAGVALALAAIGVYGVLAYAVSARTREFGVRMALGASTRSVFALVLRQGLGSAVAGLIIGIAAALAATRLLEKMLYSVSPTDPATYAAVAIGLFAIVVVACVVPARRAVRADPVASLREE